MLLLFSDYVIYLGSNGFYTRPLQLAQRQLIRCSSSSNIFYMYNFAVIGAFISYDSHLKGTLRRRLSHMFFVLV